MRVLTIACLLFLTVAASAQQRSGRHFRSTTRLPATAKATQVVEATTVRHVKPLKKLRSGRAWPRHHFRRLPAAKAIVPAGAKATPVDAAAKKAASRRGFWGPRK